MAFIPYEKFEIITDLNTYKTKEKIMTIVGPLNQLSGNKKPFQGKIMGNVFRISRTVEGMTFFLPVIQGEFQDNNIKVTMRFNLKVLFQMIFGALAVLIIGFIMLHRGFYLGAAVSLATLLVGYWTGTVQFRWEAKLAKTMLEKCFLKK